MTARVIEQSLINPGPAVTPASNPRRVGAPNYYPSIGSGETRMARTITHRQPSVDVAGLRPWVARTVVERINHGVLDLSDSWSIPVTITDLVTDLVMRQTVVLRERLDAAVAELDAANDAVTELVAQLDDLRGGQEHAAPEHGSLDELFVDLERGGV